MTTTVAEAIGYMGVTAASRTLVHAESLIGDANDLWEACKHAVALFPDLAPEFFAKAEFAQGSGAPGSVAVVHFGPAVPGGGSVKHRVDKLDDERRTMRYTVLPDVDSSSMSAEMEFTAAGDDITEVRWTAARGTPEAALLMVVAMLKTLESAVAKKHVVRHTRTLESHPETIWNILMHEDVIMPKIILHIIASYEFLEGNGVAGSIRLLKLGHGKPPTSTLP